MLTQQAAKKRPGRQFRDTVWYVGAFAWNAVIGSGVSLLTRFFIPVTAFGAYSLSQSLNLYFGSVSGSFRNAIEREVPAMRASDEADRAEELRLTAYTLLLGSLIIETAVLIGLGFFAFTGIMRLAFVTAALLNILDGISAADAITLKSELKIVKVSHLHVITGTIRSGILLGAAWFWGVNGYFAGLAIGAAVEFGLFRRATGHGMLSGLRPSLFTMRYARRILQVGGALMVFNLGIRLLQTADRFVVARYFDVATLGIYSLAGLVVVKLHTIPRAIAGANLPHMMTQAAGKEWDRLAVNAGRIHTMGLLATCALACGGLIVLDVLVTSFLVDYTSARTAILASVVGGALMSSYFIPRQVQVVHGQLFWPITSVLACTALAVAAMLWLVPSMGLLGVAIGSSAGFMLLALILSYQASRALGRWVILASTTAMTAGGIALIVATATLPETVFRGLLVVATLALCAALAWLNRHRLARLARTRADRNERT